MQTPLFLSLRAPVEQAALVEQDEVRIETRRLGLGTPSATRPAAARNGMSATEQQGDTMCRSIKPLRLPDRPATEQEIAEAALQYVRKVSGYRKPSRANQEAFEAAVAEVAAATRRMLERLTSEQGV